MTPRDPSSTAALLLAEHVTWIRALAREMCADAHLAEDLAQEACVAALERPPADSSRLRPWLAAVLRNALRQKSRASSRRIARETLSARAEALESTDRIVERVVLERELAAFVLELDEPYRTTILLRFFEELAPREIASRLNIPVNTVHSRLARGLERLRRRLDDRHGRRAAWLSALVPLSSKSPLVPAATLGGLFVNAKLTLVAVSVLVAGTLATLALRGSQPPVHALDVPSSPLAVTEARGGVLEGAPLAIGERRAAEDPALAPADKSASASDASAASAAVHLVRGRVLDAEGTPLGGIELALDEDPSVKITSGAGGGFELRTTLGSATFSAALPTLANVRVGAWRAGTNYEPVVVVAPAIDIAGSVRDARGDELAGAGISYLLPAGFDTRFTAILESSRPLGRSIRADAAGHFALARVPSIPGARLRAIAEGFAPGSLAVPDASDLGLAFVLARPEVALSGSLRGRVIDPDGRAVEGARVATGLTSTLSDEDGGFVLDLSRAVTALSVTAVKAGYRPAKTVFELGLDEKSSAARDGLVLQLGPPPLRIAGSVLDHEGRPKPGLRVWIGDPTPFGMIGIVPIQSEHLAAGAPVPKHAVDSVARLPEEDGDSFQDWTPAPKPSDAFWYWVATDERGRFEIGGLDDRKYALSVYDPKNATTFTSAPIRAGDTSAKIELPAPKLLAKLAGRLVDDEKKPVAGVTIQLYASPYGVRSRFFGGTVEISSWDPREKLVTGPDGTFSFENVPADAPFFELVSDDVVPLTYRLKPGDDPAALEVVVETRCHVELRLKPPHARADRAAFQDGDGKPLLVIDLSGGGINVYTDTEIVDGRSGVVSVSSRARNLVLKKGKQVVETHAIDLHRGEVNRLEP